MSTLSGWLFRCRNPHLTSLSQSAVAFWVLIYPLTIALRKHFRVPVPQGSASSTEPSHFKDILKVRCSVLSIIGCRSAFLLIIKKKKVLHTLETYRKNTVKRADSAISLSQHLWCTLKSLFEVGWSSITLILVELHLQMVVEIGNVVYTDYLLSFMMCFWGGFLASVSHFVSSLKDTVTFSHCCKNA